MAERPGSPPPALAKPLPGASARPWVIRAIVVAALAVVIGGAVWAAALGHLF